MSDRSSPTAIDRWGIASGFHDVHGDWIEAPRSTVEALRVQMGEPTSAAPLWFVVAGTAQDLLGPCRLELECGEDRGVVTQLSDDLPLGYHRLSPIDGGPVTSLVVHPPRCPEPPRAWGLAAQTYALWSAESWGVGDLGDAATLAARLVEAGGRVLQLSPLHAPAPTLPQEPSPYYPSSRRAISPLLIPLAHRGASRPADLAVHPGNLIDRDRAWTAKRAELERWFHDERDDPQWREWARHQGSALWMVARWNTVADDHGADWTTWPASLRHPDDGTFERRATTDPAVAERLEFHAWCQWQARRAIAEVSATGAGVVADLAVGFSPTGADAWEYQDLLALSARIGAPPDVFNAAGQDWGLPPFVPWRLRAAQYRPLIETLRCCLDGMAGIRIDHVMGLMRQYWVPAGASPAEGAYVHLDADEVFAIVALEATRAGAFVIGEDLGTVAPEMREAMARAGMLGTRVALFEEASPAAYPEMSLATATTHDLPTLAGLWHGRGDERLLAPLRRIVGDDVTTNDTEADAFVTAVNETLLSSPARVRLLTTDDLCGALDQPNRPGTVDATNWSRPLPVPVDRIPVPRVGLEPTPYGF